AQDEIWNEAYLEEQAVVPAVLADLPVSINRVSEDQLLALQVISMKQVKEFLAYRSKYGRITCKYEMQVIAGITEENIRELERFINFDNLPFDVPASPADRGLKNASIALTSLVTLSGENSLWEKSYRSRVHLAQPGGIEADLRMDQDAGEKWKIQPPGQWGFDHVSAFLAIPLSFGKLIFGDFRIHTGQGLVQNGAFRMGKGSALPLPVLSNYTVASGTFSETGRLTGIASEISADHWNGSLYISHRKEDAAIRADGTFTTILTGGLHRTDAELRKRNAIGLMSWGGYIERRVKNGAAGLSVNSDHPSNPMAHSTAHKAALPQGKHFMQFALFGNYRMHNVLSWFELASQPDLSSALQLGLSLALGRNLESVLLFRKYSAGYFSFFGNAFGEQSSNNRNEEGLYIGFSYQKRKRWNMSAYADLYRFPWYSYRRNTALTGLDMRIDGEFYTGNMRIRAFYKSEFQSTSPGGDGRPLQRSKVQLHLYKTPDINSEYRVRLQLNRYHSEKTEFGYLAAADYILNKRQIQWNFRLMYFNAESYYSREFISERDVWGSFSLPSYYGRGIRSVLLTRIKLSHRFTAWLRYAVTVKFNGVPEHEFKVQTKLIL
ncbi:MAG: hypothetical protein P8X57_00750, partial [Cyclobacteriaceae bacterium]